MVVDFRYSIGQKVFYDREHWEVVSQCFLRTRQNDIIYYNLKNIKNPQRFVPNVWQHELSPVIEIIK